MARNIRRETFNDYLQYFDKNIPIIQKKVKDGLHYSITGKSGKPI